METQILSANLDAVIIGASSVKHLEENLKSTKHGPLHEGMTKRGISSRVQVFNKLS